VVSTGHRFTLHDAVDDDWLEWAPALPVGAALLPPGTTAPRPLRAALSWTEGRFWSGDEQREGWVLAVPGGLLGPADLFTPPAAAHPDSAALEVAGERLALADAVAVGDAGRLMVLPLGGDATALAPAWPDERRRELGPPEDCLVVGEPSAPPRPSCAARSARASPVRSCTWTRASTRWASRSRASRKRRSRSPSELVCPSKRGLRPSAWSGAR
jgi:hypothetical protein